MAIQTKVIKQKMKSVGNIKKITKTMEMVSVSKMKRAVARVAGAKEFARLAAELLLHLTKRQDLRHPYLEWGPSDKVLAIVIAGNKGLCGSYNLNILKLLQSYLKQNKKFQVECLTVGRYAEKVALRLRLPIKASFVKISDVSATVDDVRGLSRFILESYKNGEYRNVVVFSTDFIKASKFNPIAREILPVHKETYQSFLSGYDSTDTSEKRNLQLYLFEPSDEEILDGVIPKLIEASIFESLLESFASEHSARMMAMKAATDNASSLLEDLNLSFNYARQDAITRELSEIIGASNALQIS